MIWLLVGCDNNEQKGEEPVKKVYTIQSYTTLGDKTKLLEKEAVGESVIDLNPSGTKITTRNKMHMQYGRCDVRMKLPKGLGTWPAVWFLGENIKTVGWPASGEIDLMEFVGKEPDVIHFSLHSKNYNHTKFNNLHLKKEFKNISNDFHIYRLDWDSKGFKYYLDNELIFTAEKGDKQGEGDWPFDAPFFMIINLAIGGNWGGKIDDSIFPVEFIVDYVKVTKL